MPISDIKVEEDDYAGYGVESLSNRPSADGMTAATLKFRFDSIARHLIVPRLNALIDALMASTADDSGAASIGSEAISGVDGTTVREQLISIYGQLGDVALGGIPNGSITDVKLSAGGSDILARFAAHIASFDSHVRLLGTTGGTGAAYTIADASFDLAKDYIVALWAHADCGSSATLNIGGTGARYIRPAAAANVAAAQMKASGLYLLLWRPSLSSSFLLINPEPVAVTITTLGELSITNDVAANEAQVVNTYFSTSGTPPSGVPDGTLFIQYTA